MKRLIVTLILIFFSIQLFPQGKATNIIKDEIILDANLDRLDQGRINQPSHMILFNEIISKTIGAFLISSILYFFVKKEDPNLIV